MTTPSSSKSPWKLRADRGCAIERFPPDGLEPAPCSAGVSLKRGQLDGYAAIHHDVESGVERFQCRLFIDNPELQP